MKKPTKKALRLAQQIVELNDYDRAARRVQRLKHRLKLIPMAAIIGKLPPGSVNERAKLLGVSRQAIYDWLSGRTRPNWGQAEKLHKLTGFTVFEIRGRE